MRLLCVCVCGADYSFCALSFDTLPYLVYHDDDADADA